MIPEKVQPTATQNDKLAGESLKPEKPKKPLIRMPRKGLLPIDTNAFDRVFISVVILVAIHLLWLRFVEVWLPLWVATILSLILSVVIVRYG